MGNTKIITVLAVILGALIAGGTALLMNASSIDVLQPAGDIAVRQRLIFILTIGLSALVVIPVFILLGYISFTYRAGKKPTKYNPEWKDNRKLETVWWGIPIVIITILAGVTWVSSHALDPYKNIESEQKTLDVQVVALQWKWLFIYPEQGVASVNYLRIPEKTPVRFSLTADAPMSAFWVPKLGSQIYSMNGMNSKLHLIADRSGEYRGYTTNINGKGYADMTFMVAATDRKAFDKWIETAQASSQTLTIQRYEALARPGVQKVPSTYAVADAKLYHTIMQKYMEHSSSPNTTDQSKKSQTQNEQPMNMMDHDGMNHEGMNHD